MGVSVFSYIFPKMYLFIYSFVLVPWTYKAPHHLYQMVWNDLFIDSIFGF